MIDLGPYFFFGFFGDFLAIFYCLIFKRELALTLLRITNVRQGHFMNSTSKLYKYLFKRELIQ